MLQSRGPARDAVSSPSYPQALLLLSRGHVTVPLQSCCYPCDGGRVHSRGRLVACQETRLRRVRCDDEACDEETVQSPVSRWREAMAAAFGAAVDTEE